MSASRLLINGRASSSSLTIFWALKEKTDLLSTPVATTLREHRNHFILEDTNGGNVDFGEGKKNIVALEGTTVLVQNATELPFAVRHAEEVQMAVKQFGKGRGVYISGLPYSFENSRVLYRAVLWSANSENELHKWYSTNYNVEVHAYVKTANIA